MLGAVRANGKNDGENKNLKKSLFYLNLSDLVNFMSIL